MTLFKNQRGSSPLIVVLIIVVIAGLGGAGYYVWSKNRDDGKKQNTSQNSKDDGNEEPQDEEPDAYAGWKSYTNDTYGISFKYPSEWKIDEVAFSNPSQSATKQEYSISLERSEKVKYNTTIIVEILGQSINATEDFYYPNAPDDDVTKTVGNLKGKQSISYVQTTASGKVKLHLFSVGSSTYLFRSINEGLNMQIDPGYWSKFDKVFSSLEIQ